MPTSPLGSIPNHNGGHRRTHALPFPANDPVNNGISKGFDTIEYTTFDSIVARVRKGNDIIERDIKETFRIIPIAIHGRQLFGFE